MFVPRASSTVGRLFLLVATTASAQNAPQDYPHWRGKTGDGYATPIVVGDAVYAFTRRDDSELLTALDVSIVTGMSEDEDQMDRRGRRFLRVTARHHPRDSATWAQPAISGTRVFVKDVTSITLWTLP
jgi:hypothetical protein